MTEPTCHTVTITLPLGQSDDESVWRQAAADKIGVDPSLITEIRLKKHSIDARRAQIKVQLRLDVAINGKLPQNLNITRATQKFQAVPRDW